MNLINTDILPDPYDPQTGDVYEFGDPFVQRLVVEDAPTREDPRVRYRIDGGIDSNLTTVAQFHRHLAGLTRLRGLGRVRVVEQAALDSDAWALAATGADNLARLSTLIQTTCARFLALADAVSPRGPNEDARLIHAATNARQIADQIRSAIRLLGFEWDDSKSDAGHALLEAVRAERKIASDLGMELDSISSLIAPHGVQIPAGFDGDRSTPTSLDLVRWLIVKSGIDLRGQQLTLPQVWEAREPTPSISADFETAKATELAADASSLMVTRDALWSTLGAVSLGSLRVPTAATHFLDSLASVYGDRTAIPLAELIDAAFAFGICASRRPDLPEIECPAGHGAAQSSTTFPAYLTGGLWPRRDQTFKYFKAIADQLRSLATAGDMTGESPLKAMRTAAAAMLRAVNDMLVANTAEDEIATCTTPPSSTLEMLASLVRNGLAANERDELYSRRDGAAAEKKRAAERDAAFQEALAIATGKGAIEAQRLSDIIEYLWVAIEGVTGRVGLERDLINAVTMKVELEQCFAAAGRAGRAAGDAAASGDRSDLNAIRSAYLDVNGTTGTISEIVGSIRGSCEMQARVLNLKALLTERESDIEKLADMLADVLDRIGAEDAK